MTGDEVEVRAQAPGFVTLDTLRYLGLDPHRIETRALVLLCQRYGLDPLLGHVSVIRTANGHKVYVTRDGLLDVAHRSGKLDGIVVEEERRNSTGDGYTARVSVWRKDMGHPFTYGAQCKDKEPQAGRGQGPEMALARAERRALRRAFSIPAGTIDAGNDADLDAIADDVIEIDDDPSEAVRGDEIVAGADPAPILRDAGETLSGGGDGPGEVTGSQPREGPLVDDLEDFPHDGPPAEIARSWRAALDAVPGVGPGRLVKYAREYATGNALAVPSSIEEISDPELVTAVRLWLETAAERSS